MSWDPSDAQVMASALCPKFTAMASVVGSSLIIRDVIEIRNIKSGALSTRHRILVGMSVCDILSSLALFMTSWPVPQETSRAVWNVGTTQTCSAQGFFMQLSVGTVLYNACLALYYLLVIRYGWKDAYIAKRVEPWMHFIAVAFTLCTGAACLALDLFNPIVYTCTITPYPTFCIQSYENKGPTNCSRGDNAHVYLVAFRFLPVCCVMVWLAVSLFLVYWKIRTIESGSSRFQGQPGRMQQRFALQASMYVGAMFIAWGPRIGLLIYKQIADKLPNWWAVFGAIVIIPIQGFFNALVYFHSTRKQQPRRSSTTEQSTRSSSFFVPSPFQLWGSFRRFLSGKRSAASSESIAAAAAAANDAMAEEEELQDSEHKDPVVEPIDISSRK